jgi:hypothetical protein
LGVAEGGDLLVFSQGIAYPHSRGVAVEGGVVVVIVIVVCRGWVHHYDFALLPEVLSSFCDGFLFRGDNIISFRKNDGIHSF